MASSANILIGTSGWHFDRNVEFYPAETKGYGELAYYAEHFKTVENNASFYHQTRTSTFATWDTHTPDNFVFSFKLNKFITHTHKLELTEEVETKTREILASSQVLKHKLGALLIQLPPSLPFDTQKLVIFLQFLKDEIKVLEYKPDVAIELRKTEWFTSDVYKILHTYNVALVSAQSAKYPEVREVTADFAYVRFHGPQKMFDSLYSKQELEDWARFIEEASKKTKRVYIYFNNTMHGHALANAKELSILTR